MKRMIQGVLVTGTLVLGSAALAQQGAKAQGKGGTAEYRGFVVPTDTKALLERLHYTNQLEIKLGQLAQQNSTNPDVKAFGETMVREHTDADKKLMSFAQSQGIKLADMPKPLNDVEKRAMAADKAVSEELQVLKGEPFDSCYIANQVGDHDATLGKLMAGRQALSGGDAQLVTLMDDLTQHVAQHRQQAYSVLGKLNPQGTGVGGAGGGTQKGTESDMGGRMGTQQGTGSGSTGGSTGTSNNTGTVGGGSTSGTTGGTTGTSAQPKK